MPSPFPGMDPYIEGQWWESFHTQLMAALQESLAPQVGPRYIVLVEARVYLEHATSVEQPYVRPDVVIAEQTGTARAASAAAFPSVEPFRMTVPVPVQTKERYLTVRDRESREVITVIEVLSPGNKRAGSDGRREYLIKRENVLRSATHLVEIDLLRGGVRLPTVESLPPADYYAFVCRGDRRPTAEVYAWNLRHPAPDFPIPLSPEDADAVVRLQEMTSLVYDRAGYAWSLDYGVPVQPPLSEADQAWVETQLEGR